MGRLGCGNAAGGLCRALYVGSHHEAVVVVANINLEQKSVGMALGLGNREEGAVGRFYLKGDADVGVRLVQVFERVQRSWNEHRRAQIKRTLKEAREHGLDATVLYQRYVAPLPWVIGEPEVRLVDPPMGNVSLGAAVGFGIAAFIVVLSLAAKER